MVYVSILETNLHNQFLQTLHNMPSINKLSKKKKKERIKKILENVNILEEDKKSYIFEREPQCISDEEKLIDLEEIADLAFGNVFKNFGEIESPTLDWERIRRKQKELGVKVKEKQRDFNKVPITRYGRCLLHEAIAMKDVKAIKKYARQPEYLQVRDNNDNTPYQMALLMEYKEAVVILKPFMEKVA